MSRQIHNKYMLAEARGHIPEGTAHGLTYATILELGVRSVAEGYYGTQTVQTAVSAARDEQTALDISDEILADIPHITREYGKLDAFMGEQNGGKIGAVHTTSDFPTALGSLRRNIIREGAGTTQATWRSWIPPRLVGTTPDFKPVRAVSMTEMGELKLRPEATDVQYTTLGFTADTMMVANYERALQYTWEMWLNDEVNVFARALRKMGEGARRTEAIVIFNAILNGVARSSETGVTTGAPSATRIAAARKAMAARTTTDIDNVSTTGEVMATDIVYAGTWADDVEIALGTQFTDFQAGTPNVAYRSVEPHMERLWGRVFGSDWILFDENVDWIDVRFLEGFQGGPKTYTKMPNVQENPEQGSFENHSLSVKVGHALGAKVVDANGVLRNQGA